MQNSIEKIYRKENKIRKKRKIKKNIFTSFYYLRDELKEGKLLRVANVSEMDAGSCHIGDRLEC